MGTHIWECDQGHIHVRHNGTELQFEDIYDLVSCLEMWLEYAMIHEMETASTPAQYWEAISHVTMN